MVEEVVSVVGCVSVWSVVFPSAVPRVPHLLLMKVDLLHVMFGGLKWREGHPTMKPRVTKPVTRISARTLRLGQVAAQSRRSSPPITRTRRVRRWQIAKPTFPLVSFEAPAHRARDPKAQSDPLPPSGSAISSGASGISSSAGAPSG